MEIEKIKNYYMKNKRKILPLALTIVIIVMGLFSIISNRISDDLILKKAFENNCTLEYGHSKCINGSLYTPFYNPTSRGIDFVSLTIPVSTGVNIYNVNESLAVGNASALSTIDCKKNMSTSKFTLKWCCERDCFTVKMRIPKSDITIKILNLTENS